MKLYLLCNTKPFEKILGPSRGYAFPGRDRVRTIVAVLEKLKTLKIVEIECDTYPKVINEKIKIDIWNMAPKARIRKKKVVELFEETLLFDRDRDNYWSNEEVRRDRSAYKDWMLRTKKACISFKLEEL